MKIEIFAREVCFRFQGQDFNCTFAPSWERLSEYVSLNLITNFLDFSHNKIGDSGARAIGKLLNGRSKLEHINLQDNKIKSHGSKAIAHALGKNTTLRSMNMRLNRLGDDGGQATCKALVKNTVLQELNLGSNDLGEPTAAALAQVSS